MTDIDFDELDRAVNSLISPDAKQPESTPELPSSPSTNVAPAPVSSVSVTTTPSTSSVTPSPLAERRSSGRFMDVVHPSSDMRSSVPPRPVSREANVTPASQSMTTSVTDAPKPAMNWPDPIDVSSTQSESVSTSVPAPVTPEKEVPKENTGPLESPFLSDAKVEKRPLGAFSNGVVETSSPSPSTSIAAPPEVPETKDLMNETPPLTESNDHPINTDTPMPAELQPGLLSIESNEDPSAAKPEEQPQGPTSITQQYTPQPSTGDKPAANMFDTAAYKKPQTHAKKKTGWLVILWIFLLLVVGTGIGAAVYFFVLPRL